MVINGEMFFVGQDAAHGQQLWETNGTVAGTTQLTDGNDDNGGIKPSDLTAVGGTLYFIATNVTHGDQIWKSDGTAAAPPWSPTSNDGGPYGYLYPTDLAAFNGNLYFAGQDPSDGTQLFASDGTAAGTTMVKDIAGLRPGLPGSYPTDLTAAGGLLYFSAIDIAHGTQLWATNGTAAGTTLLTTGNAAKGGTVPQFLAATAVRSTSPASTRPTGSSCGTAPARRPGPSG